MVELRGLLAEADRVTLAAMDTVSIDGGSDPFAHGLAKDIGETIARMLPVAALAMVVTAAHADA